MATKGPRKNGAKVRKRPPKSGANVRKTRPESDAKSDESRMFDRFVESAELMRGVVEFVGDDIRVLSVNAGAASRVGRTPDELQGALASEIGLTLGAIVRFRDRCRIASRSRKSVVFDLDPSVGGPTPCRLRAWISALGPSGAGPRFAVVALDVTESAQKRGALQTAERMLRAFFESPGTIRAIAELVGDDVRMVVVNDVAATFVGKPVEQINGRGARETGLQPATVSLWLAKCREAERTGQAVLFLHRLERAGTQTRFLRSVITPAGDGPDGPRFAYSAEDVTAVTLAEEALRRSEESYATLVQNLSGAVYRCHNDAAWTVDFISDGCLAITGYTPDELTGGRTAPLGSLMHPDDSAEVWTRCQASLAAHTACSNEYRMIHRDGSIRWVWDRAQGIYAAGGELLHIEGLLLDITDRRLETQERQLLREQLFHAQRVDSIGRLAGGVAHDFNNLLAVVLGHADLLGQQIPADDPLAEHVAEIRAAGERSMHLTRQLLGFARRQPIAPRVIDLNEAVSAALNLLRRLIGEGVAVQWKPGSSTWPVHIDPTQIDQVLTNLCVNSRDAMDGTGHVTIATRNRTLDDAFVVAHEGSRAGEYAELLVQDTGTGMDEEILAHIFDPFFTTKAPGKGTGLGLATVYGIVKQNGGYVDVETTPGTGTSIRVLFPRHAEAPESDAEVASADASARGTETILLVEDEPSLLRLGHRVLGRLGYTVLTAATPHEAIQQAMMNMSTLHLLVTDIVMPGMNGRQLANLLQSQNPRLPVLFMSGYSDAAFEGNVVAPGVHFIAKPFTAQQFAAKVRAALAERRSQDAAPITPP